MLGIEDTAYLFPLLFETLYFSCLLVFMSWRFLCLGNNFLKLFNFKLFFANLRQIISLLSDSLIISNNNSDCVPEDDRYKYFDDATVLEVVNLLNIGLSMSTYKVRDTIPSHIPSHNQFIDSRNLKSQQYLVKINKLTEENLMELNAKKTKCMIFNFTYLWRKIELKLLTEQNY